jgi:hypothetical protein
MTTTQLTPNKLLKYRADFRERWIRVSNPPAIETEEMASPCDVSQCRQMFVGRTVKTFILAQFMRDLEAGRFAETQQTQTDNSVRSLSSRSSL